MKIYIIGLMLNGYNPKQVKEKLAKIGINVSSALVGYYYKQFLRDLPTLKRAIEGDVVEEVKEGIFLEEKEPFSCDT